MRNVQPHSLASSSFIERFGGEDRFDYQDPRTWTTIYDSQQAFTLASFSLWEKRAADLARTATQLAVSLNESPHFEMASPTSVSATILFAAAEAQTAGGQGEAALLWACALPAGEARVRALIGVARGLIGHGVGEEGDQ